MTQKRISEAMDDRIDPAQFGFRKGRSTSQPIHIYRRIQEIHEEAGLELIAVLLDWEKAFDKVSHQGLKNALERIVLDEKYVKIIENMYDNSHFFVESDSKKSKFYKQEAGIKQG